MNISRKNGCAMGLSTSNLPLPKPDDLLETMNNRPFSFEFLKFDLPAGLVVFFIALPLCLGIALASGAPLISGIVAGAVGGLVISWLSGSQVSVSGPAAGLTVIVIDAIQRLGSFDKFLSAVILAGGLQIIFGVCRLGFVANYVPISVIEGMMAAIGIVIILKQIPHALGRDLEFEGVFSFSGASGTGNTIDQVLNSLFDFTPGALIIAVCCLIILNSWDFVARKIHRALWSIPASLVAVVAGVLINKLFMIYFPETALQPGQGHLVELPLISVEEGIFSILPHPNFASMWDIDTWQVAFTLAIVASIESLLSLEAADKLDPQRRISNTNRELMAQGIGNIVSASLGGLPVTSVVLRSSANIYAGARTWFSSFTHGVFLLSALLLIPTLLNQVPLASLAAILLVIGYKLCHFNHFRTTYRLGYVQFIPFVITILAIVFSDLLTGVMLGIAVGTFFVLRSTHQAVFTLVSDAGYYLLRFNKDVSFIHKAELKDKLASVPNGASLILDGTKALNIDHDIKDILNDFRRAAKFKHIRVELRHLTLKE